VDLIPQFRENHDFDYNRITSGLKFIAWGFFKKILIADTLALVVDPVFSNPYRYGGINTLAAVAAFTLQIYFDFSGYSDIALGSAKVIGIDLTNNFRNPYFAGSISEFWQRWHISLSSWIRDYIFFPLRRYLVKSRKNPTLSVIVASMVPMLISGLWHGTGMTFLVWGLLYGLFITIPLLMNASRKNKSGDHSPRQQKIIRLVKIVLTLLLVSFSWILFRSKTLSDALFIISNICNTVKLVALDVIHLKKPRDVLSQIEVQLPYIQFLLLFVFIFTAFVIEYLREKGDFLKNLSNKSLLVRWSFYVLVITVLMMFGVHGFSEPSRFIYFRF
jgi:D-alanyl-lipoteichoic acid acyltransferase DltB (MBOAT superfamily)